VTSNADEIERGSTCHHYDQLGPHYDELWEHSTRFRGWMCDRILEAVPHLEAPVVADVGGGTGIYAAEILDRMRTAHVFVVDPSRGMLSQVPDRPGLTAVHADAAHATSALRAAGVAKVDLILIKEAVHHFGDPAGTIASLGAES
jgi:ubiquinone/menaquinone biosynthesis C-methylase UbiE